MPQKCSLRCYALLDRFLIVQIKRHTPPDISHCGYGSTCIQYADDVPILAPFLVELLSMRAHWHGTEYNGRSPLFGQRDTKTGRFAFGLLNLVLRSHNILRQAVEEFLIKPRERGERESGPIAHAVRF